MTTRYGEILLDAFTQLKTVLLALNDTNGKAIFKQVVIGEKEKIEGFNIAHIYPTRISIKERDTHATQHFITVMIQMYFMAGQLFDTYVQTINKLGDTFDELMERGTPTTANNRSLNGKINHSHVTDIKFRSGTEGAFRMSIIDMTMEWETRVSI